MFEKLDIVKCILPCLIPYIVLHAIYINFNGTISIGGGFQAGVIFATSMIVYDIIFSENKIKKNLYKIIKRLIICAILGVLIYIIIGVISLYYGIEFLNYKAFLHNHIQAQHFGITIVELSIGITVSSVMTLIYLILNYNI